MPRSFQVQRWQEIGQTLRWSQGTVKGVQDPPLRNISTEELHPAFELSHRKERPFFCPHCEATFTRKDLIKRHIARKHPELIPASDRDVTAGPSLLSRQTEVEGNVESPNPSPAGTSLSQPHTVTQPSSKPSALTSVGGETTTQTVLQWGQQRQDRNAEISTPAPPRDSVDRMSKPPRLEDSLDEMYFDSIPSIPIQPSLSRESPSGSPTLGGLDLGLAMPNHDVGPNADFQPAAPYSGPQVDMLPFTETEIPGFGPSESSPLSDVRLQQLHVSAVFTVTEAKRMELIHEVKHVFASANVDTDMTMPSRIALERYIMAFFDSFLIHVPCIHIPTWQPQTTHPSLLLAVAAIGANYHDEQDVALQLYRAARLSINNYLQDLPFTTTSRPPWVIQSLFLIMAFGSWSGRFDTVQEAITYQATIGHIVRSAPHPTNRWIDGSQDLQESWKETNFVVYCFFNTLTIAYNVPPCLVNSEIDMDLPCGEVEWLAGEAHAWDESRKRSPPTPSFAEAFRCLVSPSEPQALPCSSFGKYIMLSAILQNIWHLRQACIGQEESAGLARIAYSLQKWQAIGDSSKTPLASLRMTDGVKFFNSVAMLPVAYTGLCVSSGPIRAASRTQDPRTIATAIATKYDDVQRSKTSTTAAMCAIRSFNILVRIGINLIGRTGSLMWSVQLHLHSFECCIFLSKWLETLHRASTNSRWTSEERRVESIVLETLAEVKLPANLADRPIYARVIYAWALMFDGPVLWGIVPVLGKALRLYADGLRHSI
ncbi:Fungal specific transcription factor domain-containing protein isoform 1 [Cladophialophora immunda]|nr:Fungal specific transcription factor domain-containing protein isoform 1 [Cladophialophora immunda]